MVIPSYLSCILNSILTISVIISPNLSILGVVMASEQEKVRLQIVQFAETWKSHRADWKMFTAHHFLAGGISKSTIYGVLQRYEQRGSVKRVLKATGRGGYFERSY